jgi:hypothetical protein
MRGWAAPANGKARRRAVPAPDKAAAQRRSRAQPGLPGPRAGLAASAARTRAPGGPPTRRRASGDRSTTGGTAAKAKAGLPAERAEPRRRTGLRAPGGRCRPRRNRARRASAPPECRGAAVRRRTLSAAQHAAVCVLSPAPFQGALRGLRPRRRGRTKRKARPQGNAFPSCPPHRCDSVHRTGCPATLGHRRAGHAAAPFLIISPIRRRSKAEM